MLNKELLLAQKQGLQDGEFLLTIGKSGYNCGVFVNQYGEISPNFILYKGKSYFISCLTVIDIGAGDCLTFQLTGECPAKKCRITYKGKVLEGEMGLISKTGQSACDFAYNIPGAHFFFNDFKQNVGKTFPIRIELF